MRPIIVAVADMISNIYGMPFMVQVEPTTFCNLKCPMCEHSYAPGNKHMSFETFKRLHGEFPSILGKKLIMYNLTGTGEGLMNKDFTKMLTLVSKSAAFIYFTNNFTLVNQEVAETFVSLKPNRIFVSFDGATKQTYEKMRVGANYEKVIENVKRITSLTNKSKSKRPEVIMRFVPTKNNIDELPALPALAKDLGIKQIDIPQLYVFEENKDLLVDSKTLNEKLDATRQEADKIGITIEQKNQRAEPVYMCKRGKYSSYITSDGYVTPCCVLAQTQDFEKVGKFKYSFGNINEQPLKEIWNSEKYKTFRKQIQKGIKPAICKTCPLYY